MAKGRVMKVYGFQLGTSVVEIKAKNEATALKKLVDNFWFLIDGAESIKLLGELKEDK